MKPNPHNKNINCIVIFKLAFWWERHNLTIWQNDNIIWWSIRWGGNQHRGGELQGKTIVRYNHGLQTPWYIQRRLNARRSKRASLQ